MMTPEEKKKILDEIHAMDLLGDKLLADNIQRMKAIAAAGDEDILGRIKEKLNLYIRFLGRNYLRLQDKQYLLSTSSAMRMIRSSGLLSEHQEGKLHKLQNDIMLRVRKKEIGQMTVCECNSVLKIEELLQCMMNNLDTREFYELFELLDNPAKIIESPSQQFCKRLKEKRDKLLTIVERVLNRELNKDRPDFDFVDSIILRFKQTSWGLLNYEKLTLKIERKISELECIQIIDELILIYKEMNIQHFIRYRLEHSTMPDGLSNVSSKHRTDYIRKYRVLDRLTDALDEIAGLCKHQGDPLGALERLSREAQKENFSKLRGSQQVAAMQYLRDCLPRKITADLISYLKKLTEPEINMEMIRTLRERIDVLEKVSGISDVLDLVILEDEVDRLWGGILSNNVSALQKAAYSPNEVFKLAELLEGLTTQYGTSLPPDISHYQQLALLVDAVVSSDMSKIREKFSPTTVEEMVETSFQIFLKEVATKNPVVKSISELSEAVFSYPREAETWMQRLNRFTISDKRLGACHKFLREQYTRTWVLNILTKEGSVKKAREFIDNEKNKHLHDLLPLLEDVEALLTVNQIPDANHLNYVFKISEKLHNKQVEVGHLIEDKINIKVASFVQNSQNELIIALRNGDILSYNKAFRSVKSLEKYPQSFSRYTSSLANTIKRFENLYDLVTVYGLINANNLEKAYSTLAERYSSSKIDIDEEAIRASSVLWHQMLKSNAVSPVNTNQIFEFIGNHLNMSVETGLVEKMCVVLLERNDYGKLEELILKIDHNIIKGGSTADRVKFFNHIFLGHYRTAESTIKRRPEWKVTFKEDALGYLDYLTNMGDIDKAAGLYAGLADPLDFIISDVPALHDKFSRILEMMRTWNKSIEDIIRVYNFNDLSVKITELDRQRKEIAGFMDLFSYADAFSTKDVDEFRQNHEEFEEFKNFVEWADNELSKMESNGNYKNIFEFEKVYKSRSKKSSKFNVVQTFKDRIDGHIGAVKNKMEAETLWRSLRVGDYKDVDSGRNKFNSLGELVEKYLRSQKEDTYGLCAVIGLSREISVAHEQWHDLKKDLEQFLQLLGGLFDNAEKIGKCAAADNLEGIPAWLTSSLQKYSVAIAGKQVSSRDRLLKSFFEKKFQIHLPIKENVTIVAKLVSAS